MSNIGKLGILTKKQSNRGYFSNIPVGTPFLILEEINLPAYDLSVNFLNTYPQKLSENTYYSCGYVEKGTWRLLGDVKDYIDTLKSTFNDNSETSSD